ncbi:MAG: zinc-ribbon domain-containing protein [Lachnospiraceae bacterium]|nr:zinc-ribbon domain-containing protein [Lachnospiraceae bacterium]
MFCPKCGAPLKSGARFCSKCGYSIPTGQGPSGMQGGSGRIPPGTQGGARQGQSGMQSGAGQMPPGIQGGPGQLPPPRKKKSRTWLIILLSVVLLLLIACVGGGIFYYLNERNNEALLESIRSEYSDEDEEDQDDADDQGEEAPDASEAEADTLEEENTPAEETGETETEAATTAAATEAPTMLETMATTAAVEEPVTITVQYGSQTSLSGMVKVGVQKATAYDSSHVVQRDSAIDNSAWSAFDGQSTTSWQEGAQGDGIGEYVGISFDREYQVQVITLLLGNHRSDSWYIKNNTPKTLTVNLGGQIFMASFPKEKTEFALVLSRPVAASDIRLTIEDVYKGTEYEDAIIAEVGVYGN